MSAASASAEPFALAGRRVFVAGHRGMVGSSLVRRLAREDCQILTASRAEVDLRRQQPVEDWLKSKRPDVVVIAAATVGGILANATRPAEFLYDNLAIASNLIEGAYRTKAAKVLFLGSSCIYPKLAPQPMSEDALLTGPLEPTNEWYAIAKIAGIKLCENYNRQYGTRYISAMPTNLYGPNDNYDLENSHVLPALIRKAHEARRRGSSELVVWGSGKPMREFLFVDDLADACVFLMEKGLSEGLFNIGTGKDVTIRELAEAVMHTVGFEGKIVFDASKPDGTPRKLLNVERMRALGWQASTSLQDGIAKAYADFLATSGA